MPTPVVDSNCCAFFEPPSDYGCSQCDNQMGIFTCHGCCKAFCPQHAVEHRAPLKVRLDNIIVENQKLDTHIETEKHSDEYIKLKQEIDDWEEKSIEKIKQAAAEARQKLSDIDSGYGNSQIRRINDCREVLTARLKKAEANDDYHEQHLTYWEQFLEDLRQNYIRLQSNFVRIEFCTRPFIAKLLVVENAVATRFTKWCYYQKDCVQTTALRQSQYFQEENCSETLYISPCGQATEVYQPLPKPAIQSPVEVLDSNYAGALQTGEYRFCLTKDCRFIGIISKNVSQKKTPLNTPSVFGWSTTEDAIYRDGYRQFGPPNDLQPGDTVSLLISSEQQLIRLINLTRKRTHELHIDLNKCPLPWQLKIAFTSDNYE
ncbi:unnamed protein product [Adineta ricciae]|uniref:B box-type domain-containing protein n=1 Tax=Adineta ricciae TaxID=249248 RepID=A0A814Y2C2_ADIRI|nr:unnamed protein product [Adineta ricciae]CAF1465114.1 unnamed protein product [Adineta ricciae]